MGAQRVLTRLLKKLLKYLDAGLLNNLLQAGVTEINPVSEHLELPVPPKIMDDGRIAVVYKITPTFLDFLLKIKNKIALIGHEPSFKLISSIRGAAEIAME